MPVTRRARSFFAFAPPRIPIKIFGKAPRPRRKHEDTFVMYFLQLSRAPDSSAAAGPYCPGNFL
jgi:hypothetical protein